MVLHVLTWNLFHGRAVPGAGRDLFDEFASALARWEWDLALLQEVPPWWPHMLAARLNADARSTLTSRNAFLPVRRAVATRWPDVIKSNGGGANAILIRGEAIVEHRTRRLCIWPERRWVHAVRLHTSGLWVANLHGGGALRDAHRAAASALSWAGGRPVVLGGDFNIRALTLDGFTHAGGHDVDHVFVRALEPSGPASVLDHGPLSDHAPVRVAVAKDASSEGAA
ncbi:MAG: endonuclease/exonuclease/phosphatase family protein [Solirubrobacterales bacterium]|nr:endonuclease/exonuclease/phosphatase family protein [Solirubrobacterales bacterium]